MRAIASKQYKCANYLIDKGCDINANINENLDISLLAYNKNMQDILEYMISKNAKSKIL